VLALPAIPAPAAGARLLVGLSGGLDSTALLATLAAMAESRARGLQALHVHHGLHRDADAWIAHCERLCARLDVPLSVVRVAVARDAGHGLEAAARAARYAAFEEAVADGAILALAHHRDDQAETFLLRALRASGPDGLAAMPAWRPLGCGWLWRPLLEMPRDALQAYVSAQALDWIDDDANADTALDRNFLRHRVLPVLRERWPHADAAFARSAALSGQASRLLDDGDRIALEHVRDADPRDLHVAPLRLLDPARRARVLRRWIGELGLPPLPAVGVDCIESTLLHAARDAQPEFAWSGVVVQRWRDRLHAQRERAPLPADWSAAWNGRAPLTLPDGGSLKIEGNAGFDHAWTVRPRLGGERITLPGRRHAHALKHVLQEMGVAPWRRAHLPLLLDADGEVLAAGDAVVSARFADWLQAQGARLLHRAGDD
jgi:tRNA(Ile)-lysidine synthase